MTEKENKFLFMYPIQEYFDFDIQNGAYCYYASNRDFNEPFLRRLKNAKTKQEKNSIKEAARQAMMDKFSIIFSRLLNLTIDQRYRQRGFKINYALFDDKDVSPFVSLQTEDRIIKVGITFKEHTTKRDDGTYKYPDFNELLNKLDPNNILHLRLAGFHLWDCVDKVAKKAYERGIDVLVDEDLTEFFEFMIRRSEFRTDKYPTFNPRKTSGSKNSFALYMKPRLERPWLWQKY